MDVTIEAIGVSPGFWRGRRVLLTGHTGFKGSWCSLWLQRMGAEVHGFALEPPTKPSLFTEARVADGMETTVGDVRDLQQLTECMTKFRPEIVLHMAAQSLVRLSYATPVETYAVNVMGTVHLLEAVRACSAVRAAVVVTSDKCYENREWIWGYREHEALGGVDPYSSSKGCAELVTSAYRKSFLEAEGIAVASVRSGNVIGGGDWSADRIVPDALRAFAAGEQLRVRNPHATRPWQHVLEPIAGYLSLAQQLVLNPVGFDDAWNFGPRAEDVRSVKWVVEAIASQWGKDARWVSDEAPGKLHEASLLSLDSTKASSLLGWNPRWRLSQSVERVVEWHRAWVDGRDARDSCYSQIEQYSAPGGAS